MHRAFSILAAPVVAVGFALPGPAAANEARTLYEAMKLPEILAIMHEEGVAYGEDLRAEMFPGTGSAGWPRLVEDIYDTDRLDAEFFALFEDGLGDTDLDPLIGFFDSDRGRAITGYEVSARRAMLDEGVEETAREIWLDLERDAGGRLELIEEFVVANDLIETNVAGSMNSSLAFYEGLATGDGMDEVWSRDRILGLVWEQEEDIRADTRDWIYPYLTLAFEPLEDADIEAYIAISETQEGQALNRALFGAFDVLFVDVSFEIGAAAARYMQGQDI